MGVAEREDELDTELQDTEVTDDQAQDDRVESDEGEGSDGEDDEVVVQIGEEEPPASEDQQAAAPKWVKDLRERQRQLARENAELKAKLQTGQPATKQAPTLPEKPKLADHDYDEEKFQTAMDGWYAKKAQVEAFEADQKNAATRAQEAVKQVHENYAKSKQALKVKDYQDAEDETIAQLSEVQQSILIAGATNPAAMVYALGKTPAKLKELASIKDPVKFAVAVGKLETEVKVTKRTSTKPAPESTVRSGSGSAPATTATLERLRAEADKTGDRSKVAAYLRQQRNAGK